MIRLMLLIPILFLLAGCPSVPVTQEVKIPVAVPCVKELPKKPEYRTPKLPSDASDFDKVFALARDWVDSRKYEALLEAGLKACARAN